MSRNLSEKFRKSVCGSIIFCIFFLILLSFLSSLSFPEQRIILLSFDVEPVDGVQDVLDIMNILREQDISATFFVTGEYAKANPDIIGLLENHEIACHGMTHTAFIWLDEMEKRDELDTCRQILTELSGHEIRGFRAPYNLLDKDTLDILDDLGFVYDASMISSWGIFYPSIEENSVGEIPVSGILGIPLEDVVWTYYLRMPGLFFYMIRNRNKDLSSYLFHPHHIARHKEEFRRALKSLKDSGAVFMTHEQLIQYR